MLITKSYEPETQRALLEDMSRHSAYLIVNNVTAAAFSETAEIGENGQLNALFGIEPETQGAEQFDALVADAIKLGVTTLDMRATTEEIATVQERATDGDRLFAYGMAISGPADPRNPEQLQGFLESARDAHATVKVHNIERLTETVH